MRYAAGRRLDGAIGIPWHSGQEAEVMSLLQRAGEALRSFHDSYSQMQHGDFTPSNIVYDKEEDKLTIVDLGGMGSPMVAENDVAHFKRAIDLFSKTYGVRFGQQGA